jgi:hypothetical protein
MSGMSGINRNHIGSKGAAAVAHAIQHNKVLYQLFLSENGFGAEGLLDSYSF